jgi:hypothetical protein
MSKSKPLYKVLRRGRSCHGGKLKWSLPKNGKPGKWMEIDTEKEGEIDPCCIGLHLTNRPDLWWLEGTSIYLVEVHKKAVRRWAYEFPYSRCGRSDKIAVSKCRLVRLLTRKERAHLGCPY